MELPMGEAKKAARRRRNLLRDRPGCIYCAGRSVAGGLKRNLG